MTPKADPRSTRPAGAPALTPQAHPPVPVRPREVTLLEKERNVLLAAQQELNARRQMVLNQETVVAGIRDNIALLEDHPWVDKLFKELVEREIASRDNKLFKELVEREIASRDKEALAKLVPGSK